MSFDPPDPWPPNVTPLPTAATAAAQAQRRAFDDLTAQVHQARARELTEEHPAAPSSETLWLKLMVMDAVDGDQLGTKLRLFAVELSKEAEFGQNPDFRLIPFFASIQRDCIRLLHAQLPEGGAV